MTINHINLSVQDVSSARSFFETCFNFKAEDKNLNDTLSVLTNAAGFVLVLMNDRMNEHGNITYPDAFHLGFYLEDDTEVMALFEKLKTEGIHLGQTPHMQRKTFGFYFHFQKILFEIACPISD